jgi:hypothetical protein
MDSGTNDFQKDFWAKVDALYEVPMETYGQPLGLGLFDPQVLPLMNKDSLEMTEQDRTP